MSRIKNSGDMPPGAIPVLDKGFVALVGSLGTVRERYEHGLQQAYADYRALLEAGVSKEQARCLLPVCFYTEIYWTVSLHAVAHFAKLRRHAGAQKEIQDFSKVVEELALTVAPVSFRALCEHL